MAEALKMAIASFELREGRIPTEDEIKVLEDMTVKAFEMNTQSGCMINYN